MRRSILGLCGLAILATTPALAVDSPACVRRNDVRGWSSPSRKQLILESYTHRKVLLTMNGTCSGFGVYDSFQITGLLEQPASCVVEGDVVHTHWAGEPGTCVITAVAPYDGPLGPKGQHPAD